MEFGFTLKPDHTVERTIAITKQAEAAGFTYGWLFDSHVLWKEVYPLLTLMALNTTRMRLGTCVTNPATREPTVTASALATLDEISSGRMDLGIGRGDSARRVLGKPPTTMRTLEEAINLSPAELSGGMKRRAALARSLALDPKLIVYDEPTAGLDPITGDEIGRLIRSLQLNLGVTSIVVTHDLRLTEQVADRVALLYEGTIAFLGTYKEFWQSPNQEARRFLHKEDNAPG